MNPKCLLFAIASCPLLLSAQQYNIKKGKITADNSLIATYEGKGGLLSLFNVTISSPANKPLINVKERYFDLENPLRRNVSRWIEVKFFDNPEKKAAYRFPTEYRYLERELLALLFPNNKPALIQGEAFNQQAVSDYMKANTYDFTADSIYIRQYEKENKERIVAQLSRDKTTPFELRFDYKREEDTETIYTHEVYQDGILLGRVEKIVGTIRGGGQATYYVFWKRVLTPYTFEGQKMDDAMLAFMKVTGGSFDPELVLMADKSRHKIKIPDYAKAEWQLVNWLITTNVW
ncbi:hypothetical protein A4H97_09125 [Niastella yeongjuensis]|uniref:Uncharacterized protein n=1 Tax=Niastella yeongjuensis TaxID=354355 RepID=A0A1V9EEI5_9BACT|nr:hypothetical protein [Niastella yeongjuensis]OQP44526.1 hypothetical protein A4H97_09125 [Niastella yeongjuensis]SEO84641.1 hypothetical protein SAMN05660816_03722 [Niastella yeongjuensis]